ncbi:pilin protein [Burkholderia multivorans]|uniref:CfaE/CblD family pilus tip adhesin n=1 Tax=Burkholderia multivorans TaxID=87883 RepID=UPI001C98DD5D|nr:CfaE/CblD family pilus tip adhesin [Burkholderia multivorans]MBY4672338.1 pilin protein [Burkholderia multivorans]
MRLFIGLSVFIIYILFYSFARAAIIPPMDRVDNVEKRFDRMEVDSDLIIWSRQVAAADSTNPTKWRTNAWICTSSTDNTFGRCTTTVRWGGPTGESPIDLRFVESNTKAEVVLHVMASKSLYNSEGDNPWNVWKQLTWQMGVATNIIGVEYDGVGINARIPSEQLKKIPSGGRWVATLKLRQMQWSPAQQVSEFSANIVLNVTDKYGIQIYLPEFTNAAPQVDLRLRRILGRGSVSGVSAVDMCLYDGYNSQSTWFDVTVSDGMTVAGRNPGSYSVWREGDSSGEFSKRIDYNVSLAYGGQKIPLVNNQTVRLTGVNNSQGRSVSLPGISVPVICTPTLLTLETPEFPLVLKQPANYKGNLRITFSPSSANL